MFIPLILLLFPLAAVLANKTHGKAVKTEIEAHSKNWIWQAKRRFLRDTEKQILQLDMTDYNHNSGNDNFQSMVRYNGSDEDIEN